MKNELLELMAEKQEHFPFGDAEDCLMLKLLLNQKITTFSFPSDLELEHEHLATELWQSLVAERPPDLDTIVSRHWVTDTVCWDRRPFFVSLLPVFPNLQVLRLEKFECNDADLIKISLRLPKLR
jgi:hypothetical protein